MSLDVALGYAGLFNIGHAALWGIGAYTSGLLTLRFGLPFGVGLLMGGTIAAIIGFLLGLSTLRVKGDYLALITLGFGVIVVDVARNWVELTGGPRGLPGIPSVHFYGLTISDPMHYFVITSIFALLTYILLRRIIQSPFGNILEGIREDEVAASTLGININYYKIQALVISSFFAGIAGSLYAHYFATIDPNRFTIMESFLMISMVIIGGAGSLYGPIVGTIFFVCLPEIIRVLRLTSTEIAALREIISAIIIILVIIYRPRGMLGRDVLVKNRKE